MCPGKSLVRWFSSRSGGGGDHCDGDVDDDGDDDDDDGIWCCLVNEERVMVYCWRWITAFSAYP